MLKLISQAKNLFPKKLLNKTQIKRIKLLDNRRIILKTKLEEAVLFHQDMLQVEDKITLELILILVKAGFKLIIVEKDELTQVIEIQKVVTIGTTRRKAKVKR